MLVEGGRGGQVIETYFSLVFADTIGGDAASPVILVANG